MDNALVVNTKKQKLPLYLLIIWALFASIFLALFATPHANASPFTDETDVSKITKAIKYWALLDYCKENFKTEISGSDIENGPRWWVSSTKNVNLGVIFDSWNDKNGLSGCAGEQDDIVGWISDVFKFYGIPVPSDRNARATFLHEKLGYDCPPATGSSQVCTNEDANKDASYTNSWLGRIKAMSPYLAGKTPSVGSYKDAYTYYLARETITATNGCKAQEGGSSNLILVAYVGPDGSVKTGNWSVKNQDGPGRSNYTGIDIESGSSTSASAKMTCKELAAKTVELAPAYQQFVAVATCKKNFPDGNAMFQEGCALGAANKTNYAICYSVSDTTIGNKYRQPAEQYRKGCFLGQGVPVNQDGKTAGQICYGRYEEATLLAACIKGAINRADPNYCNVAYAYYSSSGSYTDYNEDVREACKTGRSIQGLTDTTLEFADGVGGATPTPTDETTSCVIDDIGWMVCPIMNALSNLNDTLYGWVQSALILNPLTTTDASGNTTAQYQNWSIIRNIANVLLVLAFLLIIFSQITSVGISNYGVKKMLPRVIMIAIAINLSWFLMSLAVDVANVLGIGIHAVLDAAAVNPTIDNVSSANIWASFVTGTSSVAVGLAIGIPVAAATGVLSLSTLALLAVPFLLGAVLGLLAAFITLFIRNALIIILVIIAPVALVAYLLPNTEEWFKKWRKMLTSMLMLFPMAALLFAGCKFAAYVMLTSTEPFAIIAAMFVMAAPLGAMPWLARSSGGVLAAVSGRLQGAAKFARTSAQKGLSNRIAAQKSENSAGLRNVLGFKRSQKRIYDPINKTGRMTAAQKWNNTRMTLKAREDTAQKRGSATWKELGLQNNVSGPKAGKYKRVSGQVSAVLDAGQTVGLREKAAEAAYSARLENRQLNNALEKGITHRLEDAEATSAAFKGRLKQEQLERIRDGASNTAAGAIGGTGILNLRDVSQMEFAANAGAKAAETKIQRTNKESGLDEIYIQHQKEDEAGIKLVETQQDDTFKQRQANEEDLRKVVDKQDATERSIAATEEETKLRLEKNANDTSTPEGVALHELQRRKDAATTAINVVHAQEAAELERRKAPGGDLAGLTADEVRAKLDAENAQTLQKTEADKSKLVGGANADLSAEGIEAQAEADQAAAELKKIQQESGAGFDVVDKDGNSLFVGSKFNDDGTPKTPEQIKEDTQARLAAVKRNKQKAIADGFAGNWAEGAAGLDLDQEVADDQQGEMARRAAGQRIKLRLDENGDPIPIKNDDGTPRLDANNRPMFEVVGNENIVARSFQRLAADTQGDADALKAQYEREGFASGTMLQDILNVGTDGAGDPRPPAKDVDGNPVPGGVPIAEEVAAIQRIAESGDIGGGVSITEYVASLSQLADQAQKDAEDATDPTDKAEKERVYKKARERSKLVSNAMMNGFAKNSKGKPPWAGGSDEAKWIEGTHSEGPKQQVVNAFTGGKLSGDKLMNSNYEQLKPLNKFFAEVADPGADGSYAGLNDYIVKAQAKAIKDNVPVEDFPLNPDGTDSPERAEEIKRVNQEVKDNFAATLLTLDDLLDNPKYANRLETRQRNELEKTRAKFDEILKYDASKPKDGQVSLDSGAVLQRPKLKDPDGNEVDYYRRPPREYYTTPRPDAASDGTEPSTP